MVFSILVTFLIENISSLLGKFRCWLTLSGTEAAGCLTDILNSIQQRFVVCLTHFCSIISYDLVTESFISVFTGSCIEQNSLGSRKQWLQTLECPSLAAIVLDCHAKGSFPSSCKRSECVTTTTDRRMLNHSALYFFIPKETVKWMCISSSSRQWSVFDSNEAME